MRLRAIPTGFWLPASMALVMLTLALILARAAELPRRPWWLTPLRALVLVPLVMPPVASGAALAFARSLGEFGATITFAGSM